MSAVGQYAKAYVAVIVTALTSVQVALDHAPVTVSQWVTLGIGAAVALAGVWAVPNAPKPLVASVPAYTFTPIAKPVAVVPPVDVVPPTEPSA